ncbi:hypothetical protein Trydic_g14971 [Trypoxylus dichotomus]
MIRLHLSITKLALYSLLPRSRAIVNQPPCSVLHEEMAEIRFELERIRAYLEAMTPRLTKMKRRTSSPNRIHSLLLENVEDLNSSGSYITFARRLEENDDELFRIRGVGYPIADVISGNLRNREGPSSQPMLERIRQTLRLLCMRRRRERS